jgi:hypothetical protein
VKEGLKLFQEFVHELENNHEILEIHEKTRFRVFRVFRGCQRSSGLDGRVEIWLKNSYE